MTFDFTDEQLALRQAVRELLDDRSTEAAVRETAASDTGVDPKLWELLAELGLTGLVVPERYGGSGAGPVELAIVLEEMGKKLFCGPYLSSSVLAATLLTELADPAACAEFLPGLASGQRTATVVFAESIPAGERLSGEQSFVLDAATADLLLVVTAGPRVFAVDPAAASIRQLTTLDSTRRLAAITLDDAPARPIGNSDDTAATVAWARRTGEIMLAAEQVGGARAALDMAVAYARTRFQFGRAIGSFQAIKHMCADLLVEVESAYSVAYAATWALAERSPEVAALAGMAQAFCSDAFAKVAADNIQIHGGIGFTWEHPAHLYLRRARSSAQLLGDAATHRERYLTAIAGLG